MSDDIIDDIHKIREEILAEYGGDLRAYVKDLQRKTEELARAGWKVMPGPVPRDDSEGEKSKRKAG